MVINNHSVRVWSMIFKIFSSLPFHYTEELEAVKEQVGATWKPPAKPPAAPPPAESPPPDPDGPEDVYDIPSEAVEQAIGISAGGMGKPPAPPPAGPPPPIDEDIYDMEEDEEEPAPSPPMPIQPPRPPKSSPFNERKAGPGPPFSSSFQPPHLVRPPISGPKAPAAPPPDSPPAVMVS